MRILITGGAGFIGAHTARALAARGDEIVILDALTQPVHAPGARPDLPGSTSRATSPTAAPGNAPSTARTR